MTAEIREILAGGVFVAAIVFLFALIYRGEPAGGKGWTVHAQFDKVDGLLPGDDVQMGGIKVGEVAAMRLTDRFRAVLDLKIADGVRFPADTSAAVHTDGLFGKKFIALDPGGDPENMKPGASITFTQGSLRVDDLLEQIIAMGHARQKKSETKSPQ